MFTEKDPNYEYTISIKRALFHSRYNRHLLDAFLLMLKVLIDLTLNNEKCLLFFES